MLAQVENLRLTTKMIVPFAVLLLAALGIVALAERSLSTLTAQTHQIVQITAARQAFALEASAAINSAAADEKNAMLVADKNDLDVFASVYVTDITHAKDGIAGLKRLAENPSDIAELDELDRAIDAYSETGEALYGLMIARAFDEARALSTGGAQAARERALALIDQQVAASGKSMAEAEGLADALYNRTVRLLISLSTGGLACAVLMVIAITRWLIVRPLRGITEAMGRLSRGDLDIAIDNAARKDEIGVLARSLRVFREHSIALRDREIELRAARDEAMFANRSKSEFLANMGHELRTPLNAIIGFAAILRDELFGKLGDPRYRAYAVDINNSGTHLLGIINDILDLARIDVGGLELNESSIDLSVLLSDALRMAGQRAIEAHIALHAAPIADSLTVWGDERLLKQALLNLLSNAIKFSHPGGTVHLDLHVTADGAIEIRVIDNGIGMREEDIPSALKAFVQIEGSLQRRYGGTGLGLPLAKFFVELHGGALAISSRLGVGTTATITLPAERCRRILDEQAEISAALEKSPANGHRRLDQDPIGRNRIMI